MTSFSNEMVNPASVMNAYLFSKVRAPVSDNIPISAVHYDIFKL